MEELTVEGRTLVDAVAQRYAVSTDAVLTLLRAIERGGGAQAQFSHPDLGGMGQWSCGGMIMVGDMFNHGLKARVDALCRDLSEALKTSAPFAPARERTKPFRNAVGWWPASCGSPSATGSQNDLSYACFPETRRLAIRDGSAVTLYDTGDHRIGGISQQQGGSRDLTFTSQNGSVRLHDLTRIEEAPPSPPAAFSGTTDPSVEDVSSSPPKRSGAATSPGPRTEPADDVFAKIERLHDLRRKGILSEAEFADKKAELLARL